MSRDFFMRSQAVTIKTNQKFCKEIAANEKYKPWREIMSRDQSRQSIILCTPVKLQKVTLI